ncbi:MAG: hypothetical protein ACFFDB_00640 [Promethearchaeota archaeon]
MPIKYNEKKDELYLDKGINTWPFYRCKHIWELFHIDQFGIVFRCRCGKLKERANGKWIYL